MKDSPSYYANIPAPVRYDKKLPANAKLLYGEITALCNKEGFCWASNGYFADLYGVQRTTISAWIAKLEQQGYVSCTITRNYSRKIYLKGVSDFPEGGFGKSRRGVSEKAEKNTTVNTTKKNTITEVVVNQDNVLEMMRRTRRALEASGIVR